MGKEARSPEFGDRRHVLTQDRTPNAELLTPDLKKAKRPQTVLFIAGGFHSEGVIERLKEAGISYALVMPKIGTVPENSAYLDQMQGLVSWKDYFEVEQGRISVYKAFVRYVRDQLLQVRSSEPGVRSRIWGPKQDSLLLTPNSRLLKAWRDNLIRDLAGQGRIAEAGRYTRYLDERNAKASAGESLAAALRRFNIFAKGLRALDAKHALNTDNVFKLLQASATATVVPAVTSTVLSTEPVLASLVSPQPVAVSPALAEEIAQVTRAQFSQAGADRAAVEALRSELRNLTSFMSEQEVRYAEGLGGAAIPNARVQLRSMQLLLELVKLRKAQFEAVASIFTPDEQNALKASLKRRGSDLEVHSVIADRVLQKLESYAGLGDLRSAVEDRSPEIWSGSYAPPSAKPGELFQFKVWYFNARKNRQIAPEDLSKIVEHVLEFRRQEEVDILGIHTIRDELLYGSPFERRAAAKRIRAELRNSDLSFLSQDERDSLEKPVEDQNLQILVEIASRAATRRTVYAVIEPLLTDPREAEKIKARLTEAEEISAISAIGHQWLFDKLSPYVDLVQSLRGAGSAPDAIDWEYPGPLEANGGRLLRHFRMKRTSGSEMFFADPKVADMVARDIAEFRIDAARIRNALIGLREFMNREDLEFSVDPGQQNMGMLVSLFQIVTARKNQYELVKDLLDEDQRSDMKENLKWRWASRAVEAFIHEWLHNALKKHVDVEGPENLMGAQYSYEGPMDAAGKRPGRTYAFVSKQPGVALFEGGETTAKTIVSDIQEFRRQIRAIREGLRTANARAELRDQALVTTGVLTGPDGIEQDIPFEILPPARPGREETPGMKNITPGAPGQSFKDFADQSDLLDPKITRKFRPGALLGFGIKASVVSIVGLAILASLASAVSDPVVEMPLEMGGIMAGLVLYIAGVLITWAYKDLYGRSYEVWSSRTKPGPRAEVRSSVEDDRALVIAEVLNPIIYQIAVRGNVEAALRDFESQLRRFSRWGKDFSIDPWILSVFEGVGEMLKEKIQQNLGGRRKMLDSILEATRNGAIGKVRLESGKMVQRLFADEAVRQAWPLLAEWVRLARMAPFPNVDAIDQAIRDLHRSSHWVAWQFLFSIILSAIAGATVLGLLSRNPKGLARIGEVLDQLNTIQQRIGDDALAGRGTTRAEARSLDQRAEELAHFGARGITGIEYEEEEALREFVDHFVTLVPNDLHGDWGESVADAMAEKIATFPESLRDAIAGVRFSSRLVREGPTTEDEDGSLPESEYEVTLAQPELGVPVVIATPRLTRGYVGYANLRAGYFLAAIEAILASRAETREGLAKFLTDVERARVARNYQGVESAANRLITAIHEGRVEREDEGIALQALYNAIQETIPAEEYPMAGIENSNLYKRVAGAFRSMKGRAEARKGLAKFLTDVERARVAGNYQGVESAANRLITAIHEGRVEREEEGIALQALYNAIQETIPAEEYPMAGIENSNLYKRVAGAFRSMKGRAETRMVESQEIELPSPSDPRAFYELKPGKHLRFARADFDNYAGVLMTVRERDKLVQHYAMFRKPGVDFFGAPMRAMHFVNSAEAGIWEAQAMSSFRTGDRKGFGARFGNFERRFDASFFLSSQSTGTSVEFRRIPGQFVVGMDAASPEEESSSPVFFNQRAVEQWLNEITGDEVSPRAETRSLDQRAKENGALVKDLFDRLTMRAIERLKEAGMQPFQTEIEFERRPWLTYAQKSVRNFVWKIRLEDAEEGRIRIRVEDSKRYKSIVVFEGTPDELRKALKKKQVPHAILAEFDREISRVIEEVKARYPEAFREMVELRKGTRVSVETAEKVYREIVRLKNSTAEKDRAQYEAVTDLADFLDMYDFTWWTVWAYSLRHSQFKSALRSLRGSVFLTEQGGLLPEVRDVIRSTFDFMPPADMFLRDPLKNGAGADLETSELLRAETREENKRLFVSPDVIEEKEWKMWVPGRSSAVPFFKKAASAALLGAFLLVVSYYFYEHKLQAKDLLDEMLATKGFWYPTTAGRIAQGAFLGAMLSFVSAAALTFHGILRSILNGFSARRMTRILGELREEQFKLGQGPSSGRAETRMQVTTSAILDPNGEPFIVKPGMVVAFGPKDFEANPGVLVTIKRNGNPNTTYAILKREGQGADLQFLIVEINVPVVYVGSKLMNFRESEFMLPINGVYGDLDRRNTTAIFTVPAHHGEITLELRRIPEKTRNVLFSLPQRKSDIEIRRGEWLAEQVHSSRAELREELDSEVPAEVRTAIYALRDYLAGQKGVAVALAGRGSFGQSPSLTIRTLGDQSGWRIGIGAQGMIDVSRLSTRLGFGVFSTSFERQYSSLDLTKTVDRENTWTEGVNPLVAFGWKEGQLAVIVRREFLNRYRPGSYGLAIGDSQVRILAEGSDEERELEFRTPDLVSRQAWEQADRNYVAGMAFSFKLSYTLQRDRNRSVYIGLAGDFSVWKHLGPMDPLPEPWASIVAERQRKLEAAQAQPQDPWDHDVEAIAEILGVYGFEITKGPEQGTVNIGFAGEVRTADLASDDSLNRALREVRQAYLQRAETRNQDLAEGLRTWVMTAVYVQAGPIATYQDFLDAFDSLWRSLGTEADSRLRALAGKLHGGFLGRVEFSYPAGALLALIHDWVLEGLLTANMTTNGEGSWLSIASYGFTATGVASIGGLQSVAENLAEDERVEQLITDMSKPQSPRAELRVTAEGKFLEGLQEVVSLMDQPTLERVKTGLPEKVKAVRALRRPLTKRKMEGTVAEALRRGASGARSPAMIFSLTELVSGGEKSVVKANGIVERVNNMILIPLLYGPDSGPDSLPAKAEAMDRRIVKFMAMKTARDVAKKTDETLYTPAYQPERSGAAFEMRELLGREPRKKSKHTNRNRRLDSHGRPVNLGYSRAELRMDEEDPFAALAAAAWVPIEKRDVVIHIREVFRGQGAPSRAMANEVVMATDRDGVEAFLALVQRDLLERGMEFFPPAVRIGPDRASRFITHLYTRMAQSEGKIAGNYAVAFDLQVNQGILNALRSGMWLGEISQFIMTRDMAADLPPETLRKLKVVVVPDVNKIREGQADNKVYPVIQGDVERALANELLIPIRIKNEAGILGETFLDEIEIALEVVLAYGIARRVKSPRELKDPKRAEALKAELLTELFELQGDSKFSGLIDISAGRISVDRKILMDLVQEFTARAEVRKAA
ncbi:MAG: hypothetical protein ACOY3K_08115 [Candidatus Omnitrophota bacterium]